MQVIILHINDMTAPYFARRRGPDEVPDYSNIESPLVTWTPVFTYEAADELTDDEVLNMAFRTFNIGEDELAREYRKFDLRSLSVGDRVQITREGSVVLFECLSWGWGQVNVSQEA